MEAMAGTGAMEVTLDPEKGIETTGVHDDNRTGSEHGFQRGIPLDVVTSKYTVSYYLASIKSKDGHVCRSRKRSMST